MIGHDHPMAAAHQPSDHVAAHAAWPTMPISMVEALLAGRSRPVVAAGAGAVVVGR
ncbi:MAG: hypothetical protein U0531_19265 [Dehalococcoidia bacterium]